MGCSFCTAVFHNSNVCLGEAKVALEALVKSDVLVGVPGMLQKGRRSNSTRCSQANGAARGSCQAQAQQAQVKLLLQPLLWLCDVEAAHNARSLRIPHQKLSFMVVGGLGWGSIVAITMEVSTRLCMVAYAALMCDPRVWNLVSRL